MKLQNMFKKEPETLYSSERRASGSSGRALEEMQQMWGCDPNRRCKKGGIYLPEMPWLFSGTCTGKNPDDSGRGLF